MEKESDKIVDPTENVKALSEAANRRQDDLRNELKELFATKFDALRDLLDVHIANFKELALGEAKRIDAIRAVDVNAVSVASQRASDQASVLATQVVQSAEQLRTQVAQSAEALRSLVASTAATAATTLQQLVSGLSTRITTLEQAQYEGKGKQAVSDPALADLLLKVESLRESRSVLGGKSEGISATMAVVLAVATFVSTIGIALFLNRGPTTSPQVIYAPAPAVATPLVK